ncbi:MAG: hypothetical protein JWL81_1526 [Verrucomicrobiales bacterium]|nr:hypothetical protein [Verrucomicrobiales bacterium]
MASPPDPAEATEAIEPAPPDAKVPRIQRLRITINVFIQILLMLALFGLANYLASRHFKQWDYTFDRKFTLAESTTDFLKKMAVPIRITALTVRGSDPEKDLSALLQQYKENMKGKVDIKVIDTRRDVQAYEQFKAQLFKLGLKVETNGVLVQSDAGTKSKANQNSYKFISEDELYDVDAVKQTATAFKGEGLINSAIRAVTSVDRPTVGIVAGLGTWRILPDRTSVYDELRRIAGLQNIDLEPFPILAESEVPSHINALLWVAPADITEREAGMLKVFFEKPGHSLMIMLNPANRTKVLDAFLSQYGIIPQDDRVIAVQSGSSGILKRFDVDARFLDGSVLTQGIVSQSTIFLDQTKSLKIETGSDKQRAENIDVKPLLSPAADTFWGEKDFEETYPRFDKATDNGAPVYIAAAAERGAAKDPRVQVQSSRLLVFGNSAFADPDSTNAANYDFVTRSMNWMLHRDVVTSNDSSTDKTKHRFRILIKPEQWQRIFWTSTVILPLAALMAGLMVWSSRRN